MHSFAIGMTVAAIAISACHANRYCQRRPDDVEDKRRCRKNCRNNNDCTSTNEQCQCDGACGMSCFNPNALCKDLPSITNGNFSVTSTKIGGKVSYSCNAGYRIQGSRASICRADKEWYPDPPTCENVQCGDPPSIQNGFFNSASTDVDRRFIYNCNAGFGIRGSRRLTCRADGNWYPNVPTCENFADCGRSWPEERLERVVRGSDSNKNAWPWQVLIALSSPSMLKSLEQDNLLGGGSILNQKWVLSAAHVFGDVKTEFDWPRNIVLFAGITERPPAVQTDGESIVAYSIGKYHEHEEFGKETYVNDIALIEVGYKLDRNLRPITTEAPGFSFGYSIQPVCLPCKGACSAKPLHSEDQPLLREGTEVIVTGFGHTTAKSGTDWSKIKPSRTLQQALLRIASNITCREHIEQISREIWNNYTLEFTESMLCSEPDEKDACQGDSGGPLVRKVEDDNTRETRWVQVGIVSFGYGCAWNHTGYYTKVESFIPWINKRIKGTLDLMILIPGYRYHHNTDKNAYKDWLKTFGNYVTTTHAYTLSIYQYGRGYHQNGRHNPILESKLFLNGSSSLQFQSSIDSLNLTQQQAYPRLYPDTITRIRRTPWGMRNSTAKKKILIIFVERTIEWDHTNRISDSVSCLEYEGISVYFIGVTSYYSGDTSTFGTRLKAITGKLNRERNFHMVEIQQLAQERYVKSLTEYIEKRRHYCGPPTSAPGHRVYGVTCRWKSSPENTFHPGGKRFFECMRRSLPIWVENPWYALCKTDGTWVFDKKNRCERE